MRVAVVICTYEESGALPGTLDRLKHVLPGAEVFVVDDDSKDGTAESGELRGAKVLVRKGLPRGRGHAGRAGYDLALASGAEAIVEMDADGSHNPDDIPKLVDAIQAGAELAVGSRAARLGGGDDRGCFRRAVSSVAKMFSRMVLGIPLRDPTSGFRAFRTDALRRITASGLKSEGPEIVEEVYFRATALGLKMTEVPIVFQERTAGESKLTLGKTVQVVCRCIQFTIGGNRR